MSQSVSKHQEDDGSLSVFASGDIVMLACEHGHYWVLETKQQSDKTVKRALESVLSADAAELLFRAI